MTVSPYAVQCVFAAFIHSSLSLLVPHPYLAPYHSPLPTGNYYSVLYICEPASVFFYSIICFFRFHIKLLTEHLSFSV